MTEERINIIRAIEAEKQRKSAELKRKLQQQAETAARSVTQIIRSRKSIGKVFREASW